MNKKIKTTDWMYICRIWWKFIESDCEEDAFVNSKVAATIKKKNKMFIGSAYPISHSPLSWSKARQSVYTVEEKDLDILKLKINIKLSEFNYKVKKL